MKQNLLVLSVVALVLVGCGDTPTQPLADASVPHQVAGETDETVAVCHTDRSTRAWTLLSVSPERAEAHLARHPRDAQPGERVPGRNQTVFDDACVPQAASCPIWAYDEMASFEGWQFLTDVVSSNGERSTILDGNIGGYGNAFIFGTSYAQVELDYDGGPSVFRFAENLTFVEAAGCRAILHTVAEEQGVPCSGELCPLL